MSRRAVLVERITDAMRMVLAPVPSESMSLSDIDQHLENLDREFQELLAASKEDGGYLRHADAFKRITEDMTALKEQSRKYSVAYAGRFTCGGLAEKSLLGLPKPWRQ